MASVGSEVTDFKAGDRVAGFHRLGEAAGGYAEYCLTPASTTFILPPSISFEGGATLPLACMTAAISLHQALGFPQTSSAGPNTEPVLIYGGATAVGAFALQLAKLAGIETIITVAGSGIEFVKSLNAATTIIDYRAGDAAYILSEITRALNGKKLLRAFDTVGQNGTWDIAARALSPGGQLDMLDWGNVLDWQGPAGKGPKAWSPPEGINLTFTLVASAYGDEHDWVSKERAAADAVFARGFYRYMSSLLAEGKLKPHPQEILPGGLDGILQGVKALLAGKVSAKKLVFRIADSPGL